MDIRSVLAQTPLLAGIEATALDALAAHCRVSEFRSGQTVFDVGGAADCLYIVGIGRLRVEDPDGSLRGEIGLYEWAGEVGLLAETRRSSHVYAVRDSWLLRLDRAVLLDFLMQHPTALLRLTQVIIGRLQQRQTPAALAAARRPRTIALVPATPDIDIAAFARQLRSTLSECGNVGLVDAHRVDTAIAPDMAQLHHDDPNGDRLVRLLHAGETQFRHLLYLADPEPSAWSARCLRQSDRVLVLVSARTPPHLTPMLELLRDLRLRVPVELVMLRADGAEAEHVLAWRDLALARAHYFLRPGGDAAADADAACIARSLTGRAIGLVMGGGGARGFAHIGLLRALEELKLPLDALGGSSMGAFVSGLAACGLDWRQVLDVTRETFVKRKLLNDYLLPRVALIRGRKFVRQLESVFGDRQIEQLRTPYFCVTTNLTRGEAVVHDRGPMAAWIATSMAVPGVAPPVVWRGDLLVDGAVINSLPTDVMQSLERGPIIASDVSTEDTLAMPGVEGPDVDAVLRWTPLSTDARRPTLMSILFRTATLTSESGVRQRAQRADAYLRLPVGGVALFDWKRLDEVTERGYEYAMQKLPALQGLLQSCPL